MHEKFLAYAYVACSILTKCLYKYVATSTLYGKHLRETTFMVFMIFTQT